MAVQDLFGSAQLAVPFTRTLAAGGSGALYLNSANAGDGSGTVEEAAKSGRPFCIKVRDDVLVLDSDHAEDAPPAAVRERHEALLSLKRAAEAEGISSWLVQSGGLGRHHLYLVGVTAEQHARYAALAKCRGFDPRVGDSRIRPPFAPSAKYPGKVAQPLGDVNAFLAALESLGPAPAARSPQRKNGAASSGDAAPSDAALSSSAARVVPAGPLSSFARRDLPPSTWGLVHGTEIPDRLCSGGSPNRHRVDAAVAASCVQSGWSEDDYVDLRLAEGTASPKASEMSPGKADTYLRDKYQAAVDFVREHPAFRSPNDVRETLDKWDRQVLAFPFGRTKGRDVDVALAFSRKARELGRLQVGFASRSLSELLGGGKDKALNARLALERAGFLEVADRPAGQTPQYRLSCPITRQSEPARGAQDDCLLIGQDLEPNHPAFERGALAPSGYRTVVAYDFDEPRTREEARKRNSLCARSTHHKKTTELLGLGALRQLDDGRIVRDRGFDFDAVAKFHGTDKRVAARRSRHELDRAQFADWTAELLRHELDRLWMAAGGVGRNPLGAVSAEEAVVLHTGELLSRGEVEEWVSGEVRRQNATVNSDQQDRAGANEREPVVAWDPAALRGGIVHQGPRSEEDKGAEWLDQLGDSLCCQSGLQRTIESEVA
ncbi:MAG: hypothetical protein M3P85_13840 [Actinomycetota bacterium]|nr:hypothetical protein [Actinomycetota bacterium]